ncbi:MAG: DUF447 family protein [Gammaproteobacteria bacterium]|nr:DUF447 family protein [Gammaproteobacteria bacterium]
MPFIRESIITTLHEDGNAHIAPMGVHETDRGLMLAPFKPSATLNNLLRDGTATINYPDDVRIFAGCLTGRHDWPTLPTDVIAGIRLDNCLAHTEIKVHTHEDEEQRPKFYCDVVHEQMHHAYHGYNRAQFSVIELAILTSRLHMLSAEKIDSEIEYLRIGLDKTAGQRELEAWHWLMDKVTQYRNEETEKT